MFIETLVSSLSSKINGYTNVFFPPIQSQGASQNPPAAPSRTSAGAPTPGSRPPDQWHTLGIR